MERAFSPFGPIRAMTLGVAQGRYQTAPMALVEAAGDSNNFGRRRGPADASAH